MIDKLISGLSVPIGLLGIVLTILFYLETVRVKRYMILELWNTASEIVYTFDYLDDSKKILHDMDITRLITFDKIDLIRIIYSQIRQPGNQVRIF